MSKSLVSSGGTCNYFWPLMLPNQKKPYHASTIPVISHPTSPLLDSQTFLWEKKIPQHDSQEVLRRNRLMQLWMDPSSECLRAFVDPRYSYSPSLCHETIVQLSVSQTKQQRSQAWIIQHLMPHEIYIVRYAFPAISKAVQKIILR